MSAPLIALVTAATLHLGFQLTVTLVAYPALARAATGPDWQAHHEAHGRAITPLVAVVYAALAGSGLWALVATGPDAGVVLAALGAATTVATTALVAAPLHGRLGADADPDLLRRLLRADRVRSLGAVVCAAGAVGAALTR